MNVTVDLNVPTAKLVEFLVAIEDQKKRREAREERPQLELPIPEPKDEQDD